MAKIWYPVIDYAACHACGTCITKCSHGVYDTEKFPTPVVRAPSACIDHCHGCGSLCPVGAITYVGDDTGWTPPNGTCKIDDACCSGSEKTVLAKKVLVEYLYLDLHTCDRCIGTDIALDEVMLTISPALRLAGFEVSYQKIEMTTAELAIKYHFLSSPTIRVNGRDICTSVKENNCGCCSEISGTNVDCRIFEYNGENYEVPPKEMLAQAILNSVFGASGSGCSCGSYALPENLKTFFMGRKKSSRNSGECTSC
ncbi:MAG: DUF2703 domain-containing protein [Oscillospiraceae bacterium]